jgi:xyloglucan-specific exo-beta-1,4-glucanase
VSTQAFTITVTGNSAIVVRARGVAGGETIDLRVNNTTVASWTLTTAYQNFSSSGNGTVTVHFTNDAGSRDVQIDYVTIGGVTYQAENQATNTGVWMNNTCGGSNSEWLNCNGYISFTTSSARLAAPEVAEVPAESDFIQAYPNPVQDKVTVRFTKEMAGGNVLFTDVTGKVQLTSKVESTEQTFDLTQLPTGIYMVQVAGEKTRFVVKIVKQ